MYASKESHLSIYYMYVNVIVYIIYYMYIYIVFFNLDDHCDSTLLVWGQNMTESSRTVGDSGTALSPGGCERLRMVL